MRFIERSLGARDTFVIPRLVRQIFQRVASRGWLPVVEQRPRATPVVFIELGWPASGANVKITTAERLAGL